MAAVQRRQLGAKMPSRPGGELHLNGAGSRHQPSYSLNSIIPNPRNPRWKDLVRAGVNLDLIKQIKRKPDETVYDMESRVREWIDKSGEVAEEQKGFWHRLVTLGVEIHEDGLHQPIAIREDSPSARIAKIVSGERRFLAHWLIGATTISVMVSSMEDEKASKMALVENFQREEMSLDASVTALREHQEVFDRQFTMAEIGRLLNLSKGSAQGIYEAINAPEDDPVIELLDKGEFTKPYHLKKYFDDRKGKQKPVQKKQERPVERSNLTEGESPSFRQGLDSRSNLTEGGSTDQASGDLQRSNLTAASSSDQARDDLHRSNLTEDPEVERQVEGDTSRSNLTAQKGQGDRWEDVRDFLASITFDFLEIEGGDQQRLSDQIEHVSNADALEQLIAQMASHHKRGGGQGA